MEFIPNEIMIEICSNISILDAVALMLTSRKLYYFMKNYITNVAVTLTLAIIKEYDQYFGHIYYIDSYCYIGVFSDSKMLKFLGHDRYYHNQDEYIRNMMTAKMRLTFSPKMNLDELYVGLLFKLDEINNKLDLNYDLEIVYDVSSNLLYIKDTTIKWEIDCLYYLKDHSKNILYEDYLGFYQGKLLHRNKSFSLSNLKIDGLCFQYENKTAIFEKYTPMYRID